MKRIHLRELLTGSALLAAAVLPASACGASPAGTSPGAAAGITSADPAAVVTTQASGPPPAPGTFAAIGDTALDILVHGFYDSGTWHKCSPGTACGATDRDWGADSLTYALYMRWALTGDRTIPPLLGALNTDGPAWGVGCTAARCDGWSDVATWDSVAAAREYAATGDATAFTRAEEAFAFVNQATVFALGACPAIDYQQPEGGGNQLKTLETDSTYIKAALLLYQLTSDKAYLTKALTKYESARRYFLDPAVPLYSVYVFDDGRTCSQLPHRFFASVNGNMIWNGVTLAAAAQDPRYLDDAVATARALVEKLADAAGVYADLQAENDITEPLIEAMYGLATQENQSFARDWLLENARAEASALSSSGAYGRFFDGPAPKGTVSMWQTGGGVALAFAAQALDPNGTPSPNPWLRGETVIDDISTLPASLSFTGSAIALVGTLGEKCCESGHARVFIDGTETFDQTGIWQDKVASGGAIPDSVLFAWRWPASGAHTLTFQPGDYNAKEGGSFLHVQSYYLVP